MRKHKVSSRKVNKLWDSNDEDFLEIFDSYRRNKVALEAAQAAALAAEAAEVEKTLAKEKKDKPQAAAAAAEAAKPLKQIRLGSTGKYRIPPTHDDFMAYSDRKSIDELKDIAFMCPGKGPTPRKAGVSDAAYRKTLNAYIIKKLNIE